MQAPTTSSAPCTPRPQASGPTSCRARLNATGTDPAAVIDNWHEYIAATRKTARPGRSKTTVNATDATTTMARARFSAVAVWRRRRRSATSVDSSLTTTTDVPKSARTPNSDTRAAPNAQAPYSSTESPRARTRAKANCDAAVAIWPIRSHELLRKPADRAGASCSREFPWWPRIVASWGDSSVTVPSSRTASMRRAARRLVNQLEAHHRLETRCPSLGKDASNVIRAPPDPVVGCDRGPARFRPPVLLELRPRLHR